MKKTNIIHIVIDAVRYYNSQRDERDKLHLFDQLKEDPTFYSFEKMVVSAPSSVMSAITMLTGVYSYPLAKNYNDFKFDFKSFPSLPEILKKENYKIYSLFNAREMREKMNSILPYCDSSILPKGVKLSQYKWKNTDINNCVHNMIKKNYFEKDPFYLMLWYNSRFDTNTSITVENMLNTFKKKKFYKDTIIIVTADHGYPDQRRGLTSDGPDLKKVGLSHDCILTDDNICVPFSIKFPDNNLLTIDKKTRETLYKTVISQETIYPTILSLLQKKAPESHYFLPKGKSLETLISNPQSSFWKNYLFRSDARFIFQPNRISSLRNQNFKYIYHHETNEETLYNLKEDPKENHNIASSNQIQTKELHALFLEQEKNTLNTWSCLIKKQLDQFFINTPQVKWYNLNETLHLIFLGKSLFVYPIWDYFCKNNKKSIVYATYLKQKLKTQYPSMVIKDISEFQQSINTIILIDDLQDKLQLQLLKKHKIKQALIIDCNINFYKSLSKVFRQAKTNAFLSPFKSMAIRRELYYKEPLTLLKDLYRLITRLLSGFIK